MLDIALIVDLSAGGFTFHVQPVLEIMSKKQDTEVGVLLSVLFVVLHSCLAFIINNTNVYNRRTNICL